MKAFDHLREKLPGAIAKLDPAQTEKLDQTSRVDSLEELIAFLYWNVEGFTNGLCDLKSSNELYELFGQENPSPEKFNELPLVDRVFALSAIQMISKQLKTRGMI